MPIRTQLLKKWVGPDPEKHIGSTPLVMSENIVLATACTFLDLLLMLHVVYNNVDGC